MVFRYTNIVKSTVTRQTNSAKVFSRKGNSPDCMLKFINFYNF